MPTEFKKVRIFVASPGDVHLERIQLSKVVEELNGTISAIAPEKRIILELIKWETHVHPGLGKDAQDVINQQIDKYDIFIGIIWKRLGTPTTEARSGTEEEFQHAYSIWKQNKSFPVMVYFCQEPSPPPQTKEEVEQLGKVVDFRSQLSTLGLIGDYLDHKSFADVIRPHILQVIGKMFSNTGQLLLERTEYLQHTSEAEKFANWQQLQVLVKEYEHIRGSMDSGDARTRKMEIVFSKMKSLAISINPLLELLIRSSAPAEKLAAIAILEVMPNSNYLKWLGQRVMVEKPFVGYHAAIALLTAGRTLGNEYKDELKSVLAKTKQELQNISGIYTDRFKILTEAENELNQL